MRKFQWVKCGGKLRSFSVVIGVGLVRYLAWVFSFHDGTRLLYESAGMQNIRQLVCSSDCCFVCLLCLACLRGAALTHCPVERYGWRLQWWRTNTPQQRQQRRCPIFQWVITYRDGRTWHNLSIWILSHHLVQPIGLVDYLSLKKSIWRFISSSLKATLETV